MFIQKFLDLKTSSALKKGSVKRKPVDYSAANSVGILFSAVDLEKHNTIKQLVSELKEDQKNVEVLSFVDDDKENFEFKYNYFSKKDVSFWGSIKNEDVDSFIDKQFDYLIVLDRKLNPFTQYVLARSNARCRVGRYAEENSPYFELMLNPVTKKSFNQLASEILGYMKKISSNGVEV